MEVIYPCCCRLDVHKSRVILIGATQVASVLSHLSKSSLPSQISEYAGILSATNNQRAGVYIGDKK